MGPILGWCLENPSAVIAGGTLLASGIGWIVWKKADERYERRRSDDPEKKRLRVEQIAREVLSSDVIDEFARSTTFAAYRDPKFQDQVEHIVRNSVEVRNAIDDRVRHGFNNFDSTLSLALTKLGDGLQADVRKQMSESQAMFIEALGDLKDAVQALDKKLDIHIAVESRKD